MNDAALEALTGMGRVLTTNAPAGLQWSWDGAARVALVVSTVEAVGSLFSALAEAGDDWTVDSVGGSPDDVGAMIRKLGGLRPGQHLFSAGMGGGDFAYLACWPWGGNVKISLRFGVYYAAGAHDDAAVHQDAIKRGLSIG